MEWGINHFSLFKFTPYIMIYITYRNLKVKNSEIDYLLLLQRRRGQVSTLEFDPIYNDGLYLS